MKEEKAYFLRLDSYDAFEYRLTFADRQDLQMLRCRLMKASSVLESAVGLGKMLRLLFIDGGVEFDDYICEAEYYKRSISDLLSRSKEIASLVSYSFSPKNEPTHTHS
jgi:hypothetical protein